MVVDNEDFGTLVICAIRYCRGRQTYMPKLVRSIVKKHLSDVSDKDLQVLINDCGYTLVWEDSLDENGWKEWKEMLITEQKRRIKNDK